MGRAAVAAADEAVDLVPLETAKVTDCHLLAFEPDFRPRPPARLAGRRADGMEVSQLLHLGRVRAVAVRAGDLEQRRQALERRMGEEDGQAVADLALADVRVPVAVRAERRRRVVHVQGAQPVEADPVVHLRHDRVERGRGRSRRSPRPRGGTSRGRRRAAGAGRAGRRATASSSSERPIVPPAPAEFSMQQPGLARGSAPARTRAPARPARAPPRSPRRGASRRGRRPRPRRSRTPRRPCCASSPPTSRRSRRPASARLTR